MTTDLWCAAAISLWTIVLMYIPVIRRVLIAGAMWGFSNRSTAVDGPAWLGRADRAYANHVANLAPFIALVLIAHVSGEHDEVTAGASLAFVGGRVMHAVFYLLGIIILRTIAFWVSLGALFTLASRLVF